MQKKQKFLSSNSKAYILDEEKRIVRIKASNADYDSDNDRIFVEGWTLRKGASFIDAHKSNGSIDLKYGEILKAYTMDGYWMNDVQLKNPNIDSKGEPRDPATWTEGEKVANSLWEGIMKGEDVRVSVGFMYDPDKITNNEKGGYDFRGQEQYELSAVIVPANANAGLKSAKEEKTIEETLKEIQDKLIEKDKQIETLTNELNTVKEITQQLNVKFVKKTLTPRLKKSLEIKSKKSLNKIEGKKTIKKLNGDKKED